MTGDFGAADPLAQLAERAPAAAAALERCEPRVRDSAALVLGVSEFVRDALIADPTLLEQLSAAQSTPYPAPSAAPEMEEAAYIAQLRRWRRREFARIAWRDLSGWSDLAETLEELSAAADGALRAAHDFALRTLRTRYGVARGNRGGEQSLIIVAMGKLGGRELNFSSDVDLVLLFPEGGETDGPRGLSNEEFFTRLAQMLVRLLEQQTEDGFVFRIDLRLRPFGDSGPVVSNGAALEDYLQIHGRDWERYAWVKARPVTAPDTYAILFRDCVRPFVYRRYLDFGVLESLREMKALIEREVARRDLQDNIKLGDGGIREIEFIVQSFQLIRGGQDRRLQSSSLLHALPLLSGAKLLPPAVVSELSAAYEFLRRLENRLQMYADRQTHQLPADASARARIARSMHCDSWEVLAEQLAEHRNRVSGHFRATVFAQSGATIDPVPALPWGEAADQAAFAQHLAQLQYADPQPAAQLLADFARSTLVRRMDEKGRRRLTSLVLVLVRECREALEPLVVLRRLLRVVEAIGARSAYFSLLLDNAGARGRLMQVAGYGDFLIGQIATHPLLLDELIDERLLEEPISRHSLQRDLEHRMAGAEGEEVEQVLEQLRHFQRAAIFRLAVADLSGRMPLMQVSDRLTDVAELIVEQSLRVVWALLTPELGVPMCGEGSKRRAVSICAIGYGKLGGKELSYVSDLDLVFLHDSRGEQQETEGSRSIDNQVFFLRFAQRLVHILTIHSAAGRLYEVDMRLRPSGKGGMLITSIDAFADYQRREAWTWEHQALLHARSIAGDTRLRAEFESARREILEQHVRREDLREQVRRMRNRMRNELSRAKRGEFDLKQDPGGIADIEFLAQYWALRWTRKYPPLAWFSDTIRQLESVGSADLVPQLTIDVLTRAYREYRLCVHRRGLESLGAVISAEEFGAERRAVVAIWDQAMN